MLVPGNAALFATGLAVRPVSGADEIDLILKHVILQRNVVFIRLHVIGVVVKTEGKLLANRHVLFLPLVFNEVGTLGIVVDQSPFFKESVDLHYAADIARQVLSTMGDRQIVLGVLLVELDNVVAVLFVEFRSLGGGVVFKKLGQGLSLNLMNLLVVKPTGERRVYFESAVLVVEVPAHGLWRSEHRRVEVQVLGRSVLICVLSNC